MIGEGRLSIANFHVSKLSPQDTASKSCRTATGQKRYCNPWASSRPVQCRDIAEALLRGADVCTAPPRNPALRCVRPDAALLQSTSRPRVMFIGHASVLLQVPITRGSTQANLGVLFDPIFSQRCSPTQILGPKRYVDSPLSVEDLPPIHICCISHDHYDHLDKGTILNLIRHHAKTIHFFVPLGLKKWLRQLYPGLEDRIVELDWFQEVSISIDFDPTVIEKEIGSSETLVEGTQATASDSRIKVACTPAQHRSGRGLFDQHTSLWCTWVVGVLAAGSHAVAETDDQWTYGLPKEGFRCFFGGDTGLRYAGGTARQSEECPAFRRIAELYGPPDLALLPISTGSSLSFIRKVFRLSVNQHALTSSIHCSVEDALRLHDILGSKQTLGIHWGTFSPADEAHWTVKALEDARIKGGIPAEWGLPRAFTVQDAGTVLEVLDAGSKVVSQLANVRHCTA